jgi:hypothetical protein
MPAREPGADLHGNVLVPSTYTRTREGTLVKHLSACLLLIFVSVTLAAQGGGGVRKPIQFAKGTSSATISNSVVRGDSDWYDITAKAGQVMDVRITALEKNAAFTIYQPGFKITKEDGMTFAEGPTLEGAGEGDDATTWSGKLPASGKYLIVVGGTRGNATYKLTVAIKP